MRAAVTHVLSVTLGRTPWQRSEVTGLMIGNPAVSEVVSSYMLEVRLAFAFVTCPLANS